MSRVTLNDVAREAGVSRATASLVVRNSALVADSTRARVEDAMARLGYVYNRGAATLRKGRKGIVGVVLPTVRNPFFAEFLSGVETALDTDETVMLTAISNDAPNRQSRLLRRLGEDGVDGVLFCPAKGSEPDAVREALSHCGAAVQALRWILPEEDYLGPDYADGMRQAIEKLAALGHRRIAFARISGDHSAAQERDIAFTATLARLGLPAGHVAVLGNAAELEDAAIDALLMAPNRPTAVVCFNDLIALALAAGAQDRGLAIGRDLSMVGFDDIMATGISRPAMASVATRPYEVGAEAGLRLMARIAQTDTPPLRQRMPVHLVVRESIAAVKPEPATPAQPA